MIFNFLKNRKRSFQYAFEGIAELWRKEKNTRVHLFFSVAVIVAGFLLQVSTAEFCILLLTIGAVWCAEAMNSARERVVDLVTLEKRERQAWKLVSTQTQLLPTLTPSRLRSSGPGLPCLLLLLGLTIYTLAGGEHRKSVQFRQGQCESCCLYNKL